MAQTATRFGERFGDDDLKAYEVEVGQVYRTETGVLVEVVEEVRGSKPLVVEKSDRDGQERMSRYSFADMINYEGMVRIENAADEGDDSEESIPGSFVETPRCPECGVFMWTGYDPHGFPAAGCSRTTCNTQIGADELIDRGYYEE
jgi:hypothetical protein